MSQEIIDLITKTDKGTSLICHMLHETLETLELISGQAFKEGKSALPQLTREEMIHFAQDALDRIEKIRTKK